jgi:hypothetical protein
VCTQREKQPNQVGKEQKSSCKPSVRLDCLIVEPVVQRWGLRIIASSAVSLV